MQRVVSIMLDSQEDHFVVLDNQRVVGTLSKREIIAGLNEGGSEISVQQVMDKKVNSIEPDQPLEDAMRMLQQQKSQVLPVIKGGEFLGMLDLENISEFILIQSALKNAENRPG